MVYKLRTRTWSIPGHDLSTDRHALLFLDKGVCTHITIHLRMNAFCLFFNLLMGLVASAAGEAGAGRVGQSRQGKQGRRSRRAGGGKKDFKAEQAEQAEQALECPKTQFGHFQVEIHF